MTKRKPTIFVDVHGVEHEYTAELANRDRRTLDALLRPVVDGICAEFGVTRAELLAGAPSTSPHTKSDPASASEGTEVLSRRRR